MWREESLPLDPLLLAVYTRLGSAAFATNVAGLVLLDADENAPCSLKGQNAWWQENWQKHLKLPLFLFAGEQALAYHYATVPGLANERGHQPVVMVDTYDLDGPYAMPIASDVDRFFDTYASYLETLVAHPSYGQERSAALSFPWEVPEVLGRDERLVTLMQAGRFDPVMKRTDETRRWVTKVLGTAMKR
jgi:hypothetical protein